jgi:hypothetical protein
VSDVAKAVLERTVDQPEHAGLPLRPGRHPWLRVMPLTPRVAAHSSSALRQIRRITDSRASRLDRRSEGRVGTWRRCPRDRLRCCALLGNLYRSRHPSQWRQYARAPPSAAPRARPEGASAVARSRPSRPDVTGWAQQKSEPATRTSWPPLASQAARSACRRPPIVRARSGRVDDRAACAGAGRTGRDDSPRIVGSGDRQDQLDLGMRFWVLCWDR